MREEEDKCEKFTANQVNVLFMNHGTTVSVKKALYDNICTTLYYSTIPPCS